MVLHFLLMREIPYMPYANHGLDPMLQMDSVAKFLHITSQGRIP